MAMKQNEAPEIRRAVESNLSVAMPLLDRILKPMDPNMVQNIMAENK